jgi:hypothetical protein
MESAAITTRRVKGIERKGAFRGVNIVFRCRGGGGNWTVLLLALSRREGRRCDAPGIAFLLLSAGVDRSCTEFIFKQPGVGRKGVS